MNIRVKIILISVLCLGQAFFLSSSAQTDTKKTFTVTLDAGHGGHDPGAIGSISREKNITLAVIRKIGKRIAEENPDVKVVYTRDVDKYVTLQGRADIANKAKSDLFLSVHVNANNNHEVSGCETYTLGLHKTQSNLDVAMRENSVILLEDNYNTKYAGFNPKSVDSYIMFECIQDRYVEKSVWLASEVEKSLGAHGRYDRGVRQAGFWVLHKTAMPAILVEIGYISNPTEEKYLNSEEGVQNIADAIYSAFLKFKLEYYKKSGVQTDNTLEINAKKVLEQDSIDAALAKQKKEKEAEAKALAKKESEKKEAVEKSVAASKEAKARLEKEQHDAEVKAKKEAEAKKKQQEAAEKAVATQNDIEYRLQLMALGKKQPLNAKVFKGLNVDCYEEGGLYKYTYGKTANYDEIVRLKERISNKFPNSMIIAFKGGKKISVKEARNFQK